jgi:hypothetical protein
MESRHVASAPIFYNIYTNIKTHSFHSDNISDKILLKYNMLTIALGNQYFSM